MRDDAEFLAALAATPTDDVLRLVYADWLDDHDRPGAAYLRAEVAFAKLAADDPRREAARAVLQDAGENLEVGWLAAVNRGPFDGCRRWFRFLCPQRWEHLQPTGRPNVRQCGRCDKEVHFCTDLRVARSIAVFGGCVALDPRLTREPGDLEPQADGPAPGEYRVMMGVMRAVDDRDDPPPRRRGWL